MEVEGEGEGAMWEREQKCGRRGTVVEQKSDPMYRDRNRDRGPHME